MSLLSRIKDAEECRVAFCQEPRVDGAEFCGAAGNRHLTDFWQHRLFELADGTFAVKAGPLGRLAPKDMTAAPA